MPRQGRIQSGTGGYHVMMRGINRQQIFESDYVRHIRLLFYGQSLPFVHTGESMDYQRNHQVPCLMLRLLFQQAISAHRASFPRLPQK